LFKILNNTNRSEEDEEQFHSIEEFCYHLALNHDVAPERSKNDIIYSASSPDENALVSGARHFGYFFYQRDQTSAIVQDVKNNVNLKFDILNILKFSSKRKRSSVIVRRPNNSIVLYCKGADNVILERLKKNKNKKDELVLNNSIKHTTQFAADGLRTLMISMKNITQEEYDAWNDKYIQATLSIKNRKINIENICEEMETNLTLIGVTGIEDRLQDGVSNAIACLRSANIKVWVLTGDKVDTAVNIGYACALLTTDMNLMYVTTSKEGMMLKVIQNNQNDDGEGEEQIEDPSKLRVEMVQNRLNQLLVSIEKKKEITSTYCRAMIVDTYVLSLIESGSLENLFLKVASYCSSVVCARVSPSQKATVVQFVRTANPKVVTLGIGDGANDVPMIQSSHIGIGISGQEGLQAVNSSDYAIAQFRFLKKLILVHGRYSSRRISFVINYIFYKNIFAVIPAFFFGFFNAMSGRLLFNVWMQQTFNLVTFIPICVYGIFDRDVEPETAMQYPQLYQETSKGIFFSTSISGWWLLLSLIHASISYYVCYYSYTNSVDQIIFGSCVQFIVVIMCNIQLLVHSRYISKILILSIALSLLLHVSFIWLISEFSYYFIEDLEYEHAFM
jgi:phospholipid-translocating P-type ATPase (flippase)